MFIVPGPYRIPAFDYEMRGAYTNTTPVDAYRGAGRPEAAFLIERIMDRKLNYFVSTVRDATAEGLIDAPDPEAKAKALFACYQGTVAQARIQNDIELLQQFKQVARDVLGVKRTEPVAT